MSKGDAVPTGSLIDRVRAESHGPGRRWPRVVIALVLLLVLGGVAAFVFGRGSGLGKKLGITSETPYAVMRQHLELGNRAYKAGNFADAIISYRQAIEAKGDVATPHRMLGMCYFRLEPPKEGLAVESLRKARALDKHDVEATLELARYHLRNGRSKESLRICEAAQQEGDLTAKDRGEARISFLKLQWTAAQAARALGKLDLAIDYATTYAGALPQDGAACLFVAYLLQRRFESNRDPNDLQLADEFLADGANRARGLHQTDRANPDYLMMLAEIQIARGLHLSLGRTDEEDAEPTWKREAHEFYKSALRTMQTLKGWKHEGGNPTDQVKMRARILILLDEIPNAIEFLRSEHQAEPRWETMAGLLEVMLRSDDPDVLEEARVKAEIAVTEFRRPEIALLRMRIKDRLKLEEEADRDLVQQVSQAEEAGEDSSLWLGIIAARLRGRGKIEESEKNYRIAIGKNPRNIAARLGLLDIVGMKFLTNAGDAESRLAARAELDQELGETEKLSPGATYVRLWKGVTKFSDGRLSEARQLLDQVVALAPNTPLAQLILGRCRQRLGDSEGAITSFKRVIALEKRAAKAAGRDDPPLESSCLALLTAYVVADRLKEAELWARDAVKYHPRSRELTYYQGVVSLRLEDHAAAQRIFERLTTEHPTWGVGHGMLGQSLYLRGLRRQAESAFREGLRLDDRIDVRLIVARFFLSQKDLDRARVEYEKIVERFAGDPYAYRLLGHFHHVTGERDKAREMLEKGIEIAPDYLPNYEELADTYLSAASATAEDLAEARRLASEVLSRRPDRASARLLLGRALLRQREVAESIAILEELLDRYPDWIPAKILLAEGLLQLPEPETARIREHLEAVLARQPEHPRAVAIMGRLTFREAFEMRRRGEDPELANRRLMESLKYDPTNVGARLLRADTLYRMAADDPRKLELAIQEAKILIETRKNSPVGYILLGEILSGKAARSRQMAKAKRAAGETAEAREIETRADAETQTAEESLLKGVELAPTFHGGPLALGEHYLRLRRFAEAEAAFAKAMANEPRDLRSFRGAVISLTSQDKWSEAETLCRRRREAGDDPAGLAAFQLGRILEREDPPTEAATIYEDALEKSKRSEIVAARLVIVLGRLDRSDDALALMIKLRDEVPESAYYAYEVGRIQLRRGKVQEARAAFETAIGRNDKFTPAYAELQRTYLQGGDIEGGIARFDEYLKSIDLPAIRFILGTFNETQGNYGLAREHYERALVMAPNHYFAANNLAWILSWHEGNADRALHLALKARSGMPDHPAVADTLAWVYVLKGEFGRALELLEDIETSQKDDVGYQLHRARALEGLGRLDEARKWLVRAQEGLEDRAGADEHLRREIRETRDRIQ